MVRNASRSRLAAGACLLASAVFLLAPGRGEPTGDDVARRVEAVVHARHLSRQQADPVAITRIVRNELAAHPSLASHLDQLIDYDVEEAFLSFAPLGAVPDPRALYRLPYDPRIPRLCSLGVGGKPTHTGADRYAWDFVMPRGTEVRAARDGVVVRVVDGFTRGGLDPSLMRKDNIVFVLHGDGTYAMYAHLSPGIPVKEGQRVAAGSILGRSGSTGYASGPHLHVEVVRTRADRRRESVPIRFSRGSGDPFVPEVWHYYGWVPRPTVGMRILARGGPVGPKAPLPLEHGAVLPFRVQLMEGGGLRDVTSDPRLRLVAMTPWNLAVDGPGRIAARPTDGFHDAPEFPKVGVVLVYFGLDGGAELGVGELKIAPAR